MNFTKNYQFETRFHLEEYQLEQVHQARLLGLVVSDDFSWKANTECLVKKAYKRIPILTNLFQFSIPKHELVNIYKLYIRSVVEQSCVVWHSSLTKGEILDIERVQKVALRIILKQEYISYENALNSCGLKTLSERRCDLALRFARKCTVNPKTTDMFPPNKQERITRVTGKFEVTRAKTVRLAKSAIPYMQNLLNSQ